jgi:hypothetical protein
MAVVDNVDHHGVHHAGVRCVHVYHGETIVGMSDHFIDRRWEQGIPHYNEVTTLIRHINMLDSQGELDFELGGDGDLGETLAYFLDELIDRGIISITINEENV